MDLIIILLDPLYKTMSIQVDRSLIDEELNLYIRTNLFLQPKEEYKPNSLGFPSSFSSTPSKKPILFYKLSEDKKSIFLPFTFAKKIGGEVNPREHVDIDLSLIKALRPEQIDVVREATDQLNKEGTAIINLPPASGKTVIGAALTTSVSLLTIVLVHREALLGQWKKTYETFTDASVWIVGEPFVARKGRTSNPLESSSSKHVSTNSDLSSKEEDLESEGFNIIICLDQRTDLIPAEIKKQIGLVIIDEAHAFCTPSHVGPLLSFQPRYIIIETATIERPDGMHCMLDLLVGNHRICGSLKKEFTVIRLETGIVPIRQSKAGRLDWSTLIKSLMYSEERNQIILSIIEEHPASKIMILTSEKDHVHLLVSLIKEMGETVDFLCGTKKTYSDSRVFVGTIPKIGVGFDEATACPDYKGVPSDIIILATSVKQKGLLLQMIGRGFRADNPTIYHLVDEDKLINDSHWKVARALYNKSGATIIHKRIEC